MAYTGSPQVTSVGLRWVRMAQRDTDGTPKIPSTVAAGVMYPGTQISAAQALTITPPEPQRIPARGDDVRFYTFQLPPTEGPTGELRVAKEDHGVISLLTDTNQFGSPTLTKIGLATSKLGYEPSIMLWGMNEAIDSDIASAYFGTQVWNTYLLLNSLAHARPSSKEDSTIGLTTYNLILNDSTVDEFGHAFTDAVEGFTRSPWISATSRYKFWLECAMGDSSPVTAFELTHVPVTNGAIFVFVNNVQLIKGAGGGKFQISGNDLSLGTGLGATDKVVVEYEWEE